MKKMMIWAGIAAVTMAAGCKKIKSIANINVDIPYSTQVTVPDVGGAAGASIPGGTVISFPPVGVPTNSQQYMDQYHTSASNIIAMDLKSLALEVLTPPTGNFDFVDTVQLYISAPGQEQVLVAYQYNIPKGAKTLAFYTLTDVNLKNYFLADSMYFSMRAHINAVPMSNMQLNVAGKFHLLANPLE